VKNSVHVARVRQDAEPMSGGLEARHRFHRRVHAENVACRMMDRIIAGVAGKELAKRRTKLGARELPGIAAVIDVALKQAFEDGVRRGAGQRCELLGRLPVTEVEQNVAEIEVEEAYATCSTLGS
jgi:hypothetical protein